MLLRGLWKFFANKLITVPSSSEECIWVSTAGNDTYGTGMPTSPYATIGKAFEEVDSTRKTVIVEPGEYDEALTWPTQSGVKLIGLEGQWGTIIKDSDAGDAVITVAPGVQTSTWEMWMENIYIDHGETGQDGIQLTHTDVAAKMNVYLRSVGGDGSSSDKFLTMTHGGSGNAIRVYWDYDNGGVEGIVYMDTEDAGDRLYITNVRLAGGLQSSADDIASNIRLVRCIVKHEGVSGGHSSQTITAVCCYSETSGTYAALDTDDLAGSHSESIVA